METHLSRDAGTLINDSDPQEESPKRIVILRPDHLGDLILFSGSLRHFRSHWPSAHITLCVRSYGRALFAHCPHIDELMPYEPLRWVGKIPWPGLLSKERGIGSLVRSAVSAFLGMTSYDLAILPLAAPWVNHHRIMQMIPAKARLGTRGNVENQTAEDDLSYRSVYYRQLDNSHSSNETQELEANRQFLHFLGIDVESGSNFPEFWTTSDHRDSADKLIKRDSHQVVLGIAPGVSSPPGKRLAPEWYAEALRETAFNNLHVILLGAPSDTADCEELVRELIKRNIDCQITNLAGKTSVLELVECMRRCDILLCNDAAPLHIAAGLGKPVVGIMGGGHFGRFYPWGSPETSRTVRQTMDCYGCNWKCNYAVFRCIHDIPPSAVAVELHSLLNLLSRRK